MIKKATCRVRILSQTKQRWRSATVDSVADAVKLTHGIRTQFTITDVQTMSVIDTERYNNTLRKLVKRWRDADKTVDYKLKDTELFKYLVSVGRFIERLNK